MKKAPSSPVLALTNKALSKVGRSSNLMRLRMVATMPFSRSEATNFDSIRTQLKGLKLDRNDVVAFVSMTGNQVLFVYNPGEILIRPGLRHEVLRSVRLRLRGRQEWNPLMLVNYAAEVGIQLEGLKKFEDHYAKLARETAHAVAKSLGVSKEMRST